MNKRNPKITAQKCTELTAVAAYKKQCSILSCVVLLTIALVFSLIIGCTGDETTGVDTRVPEPPVMIPHLGDTGDSIYVNGELLNDSNNGIDTVPDNDWIRIQWRRINEPNLDYMKIYRFSDFQPDSVLVDSLSRSQIQMSEYVDRTLHRANPVGQMWSYYTQLYLTNGNYSLSDTVSYKLTQKPFLMSPANNVQLRPDEIEFQWERTDDAIHYRVLVLDSEREYIWHEDYYIIEDSDYTLEYSGPDLSYLINHEYKDSRIIWRVDSFGSIDNEEGISISGAESRERFIELVPG